MPSCNTGCSPGPFSLVRGTSAGTKPHPCPAPRPQSKEAQGGRKLAKTVEAHGCTYRVGDGEVAFLELENPVGSTSGAQPQGPLSGQCCLGVAAVPTDRVPPAGTSALASAVIRSLQFPHWGEV